MRMLIASEVDLSVAVRLRALRDFAAGPQLQTMLYEAAKPDALSRKF